MGLVVREGSKQGAAVRVACSWTASSNPQNPVIDQVHWADLDWLVWVDLTLFYGLTQAAVVHRAIRFERAGF